MTTGFRVPYLRSVLWVGFFALILGAWVVMFWMVRMSGVDVWGRPQAMNMMPMNSFAPLVVMWGLMMAAMMLPTLVPTLRAYDDLRQSAGATRAGWLGVLTGYFAAWAGFAALISAAQVGLLRIGWIDTLGAARSGLFAALLLIVAGAFQFTKTKEICHGICHAPTIYFLGHWRAGFAGGTRMGAGLGLFCVGCCWAIMALGFVGGVMSLAWMGLATLFMVFEKLPQIGHVVTRPMGGILIFAGAIVAVTALM